MSQKIRAFVAVEISADVRARVGDVIERFRSSAAKVKWVAPENLHITLKFLGDVEAEQTHEVCRAVEQAVADLPPFEFQLQGAGAFPGVRRPRNVWLGVGAGSDELVALNERIEAALKKLGFRPEGRRFQPHLTIGRVRRGGPALAELGELIARHEDLQLAPTPVDEVVVFSSRLDASGPTYQALARAPLGGAGRPAAETPTGG